ncbi:MAG: hypothetical protein ACRC37_06000 [Lentisphaeria bacterium]
MTTPSGEVIVLEGDLMEMLDSINDEIQSLKDDRTNLESELSDEKLNADVVNKSLAENEKKLRNLKARYDRIRSDANAKKADVNRAKGAYGSLLPEVRDLRGEAKQYAAKIKELETKLVPINNSIKEKEALAVKIKGAIGKSSNQSQE